MPLVYPDNSALGRLSDPAPGAAISVEALRRIITDAADVERILDAFRTGRLSLLSSEVLDFEVRQAPDWARTMSLPVLALATTVVPIGLRRPMAHVLQANGFRELDALHIAAAYTGGAAYAISCDDHWLRRAALVVRLLGPGPIILTPGDCVRREAL